MVNPHFQRALIHRFFRMKLYKKAAFSANSLTLSTEKRFFKRRTMCIKKEAFFFQRPRESSFSSETHSKLLSPNLNGKRDMVTLPSSKKTYSALRTKIGEKNRAIIWESGFNFYRMWWRNIQEGAFTFILQIFWRKKNIFLINKMVIFWAWKWEGETEIPSHVFYYEDLKKNATLEMEKILDFIEEQNYYTVPDRERRINCLKLVILYWRTEFWVFF